jgi:hypothetical protein
MTGCNGLGFESGGNKKAVDASSGNRGFYVNFYQAAQQARS